MLAFLYLYAKCDNEIPFTVTKDVDKEKPTIEQLSHRNQSNPEQRSDHSASYNQVVKKG
jgi:hypothetical protein